MATVDEIFTTLNNHMIQGLMFHDDMRKYYSFLGLNGYRKTHENHYMHENKNYINLYQFYMDHYERLIPQVEIAVDPVVPKNWYKYKKIDVDANTKRNAIKSGIELWVKWETDTKKLLCDSYKQLIELGEIASAKYIEELIEDVDGELLYAKNKQAYLIDIDYDLIQISVDQKELYME